VAGSGIQDEEIISGINITPMVDIILVLLIIFMVTAAVINDDSIKVELPEAATGEETKSSTLGLTIDTEGQWYLNGSATSEEALRAFIRSEKAQDAELQAVVSADRAVAHGEVVKLIDVVKQEGVVKFAINIDQPSFAPTDASPGADQEPTP